MNKERVKRIIASGVVGFIVASILVLSYKYFPDQPKEVEKLHMDAPTALAYATGYEHGYRKCLINIMEVSKDGDVNAILNHIIDEAKRIKK